MEIIAVVLGPEKQEVFPWKHFQPFLEEYDVTTVVKCCLETKPNIVILKQIILLSLVQKSVCSLKTAFIISNILNTVQSNLWF